MSCDVTDTVTKMGTIESGGIQLTLWTTTSLKNYKANEKSS